MRGSGSGRRAPYLLQIFEDDILPNDVRQVNASMNATHDGLDHHPLLALRHNGRLFVGVVQRNEGEKNKSDAYVNHSFLTATTTRRAWRSVHLARCSPLLTIPQAFASPNSSTAAAVTFITFVQDLKKKTKAWGPMIELCANGEKTLERFRYQFPDDWLYSDQLRGEWSAYNEILKRKNDSIQEQLGA